MIVNCCTCVSFFLLKSNCLNANKPADDGRVQRHIVDEFVVADVASVEGADVASVEGADVTKDCQEFVVVLSAHTAHELG